MAISWVRGDIPGYITKRQRISVTDGLLTWCTNAMVPLRMAAEDFAKTYSGATPAVLIFHAGSERVDVNIDQEGNVQIT